MNGQAEESALFVFAHQDDEMAAVSRIVFELDRGARVTCAFLTDGGSRVAAAVRDAESLAVLTSLGANPGDIAFIGSEIPIADGTLVEHLDLALERLDDRMRGVAVDRVYCLAWEGGHQDHDASELVAAAFAARRGVLDRCFELPLYHGWRTHGALFRVLSPLAPRELWQRRRLTLRQGIRYSMLAWRYRSQRSSWLALFPEMFLKQAILRRELVRTIDPARFREVPHPGTLYYERRFRFPYERFARTAREFIDAHFRGSARA